MTTFYAIRSDNGWLEQTERGYAYRGNQDVRSAFLFEYQESAIKYNPGGGHKGARLVKVTLDITDLYHV